MSVPRSELLQNFIAKTPVEIETALKHVGAASLPKVFGSDVFTDAVLKELISENAFKEYLQMKAAGASQLSRGLADIVANAMLTWALSKGATHYSHWFHPLLASIGGCAEKHDSFLDYNRDGSVSMRFPGKLLIQGEPDASSFPSGGLRATAEARGYTIWDISSPPFIRTQANGTTLIIPTAFCDWHGNAQDRKTPLLRSEAALSSAAVDLIHLLTGESDVTHVHVTCGAEQEFFLVDRGFYLNRPDLVLTGRTLLGAAPSKGQELEDHYFGKIPQRIQSFLNDIESTLWKLGVPLKTRHNEVAPNQYEIAPIFEAASVATDHNLLLMDVLREAAPKHGLACLLHEKPFAGVNGSGKHNNYSLGTNTGLNLFDPSDSPMANLRFIVFLTALIRATDVHADLLRAGIATPGNDYRLGANEAPPAIITIFLGQELDALVQDLMHKTNSLESASAKHKLALGVSKLPHISRDTTDRNRTSPFAFTGNKFEFRAQGSSQSMDATLLMINVSLTESLLFLKSQIESDLNADQSNKQQVVQDLISEVLRKHYRVVNNGNNYAAEWPAEAAKRGLLNRRTGPDALAAWYAPENIEMFAALEVLSADESHARSLIYHENYLKQMLIETRTLAQLVRTHVLPSAIKQQKASAESLSAAKAVFSDALVFKSQEDNLRHISVQISALYAALADLPTEGHLSEEDYATELKCFHTKAWNAMLHVRGICDDLESIIEDSLWTLPKYSELLFLA